MTLTKDARTIVVDGVTYKWKYGNGAMDSGYRNLIVQTPSGRYWVERRPWATDGWDGYDVRTEKASITPEDVREFILRKRDEVL